MRDVIKRRGLNLEFEYEHEKWAFNANGEEEIYCDLIKDKFRTYKDSGLLIHDYKPCFHVDEACVQTGDTAIGLRINRGKIECTELDY